MNSNFDDWYPVICRVELSFCWKYFIEKVYKLILLTIGTSLPSQLMLFATLIHFAKNIATAKLFFLFRWNYILHLSINSDYLFLSSSWVMFEVNQDWNQFGGLKWYLGLYCKTCILYRNQCWVFLFSSENITLRNFCVYSQHMYQLLNECI